MTAPQTRIFLVDDHPLVREWLATLLRQQPDFEVCGQAEDARDAFTAMLADPPDVAIVDLSLKTSSGLDLIKELSDRLPETQVIVLSMHEEIFYAERAMRAGARGYVTKRESTHRIVEAVHEVQAGRLYANAELLAKLAERIVGRNQSNQPGSVETLSDRELEVFRRLGEGQANRLIAEELHLSIKTVQAYCARIKDKLGLATASELAREAMRWADQKNRH
ncbi:MAG TPA: response regulator transcription factor [Opitutaceae bacterium]|jgi:DNA-binding NarL/FixJ family response regulator|nr:response regulator transcription factor [Opitutaceae bacterium]